MNFSVTGFRYDNLTYGPNTSINPFFYGTYLAATKASEPSKQLCSSDNLFHRLHKLDASVVQQQSQ